MVEEITPEALHRRLEDGDDIQVVDIRPRAAFERGHIPGAMNIPFPDLPREIETREWSDEIVVVCPKGESSIQAARLLESYEGVGSDARVVNMKDGYDAWEYGLETGSEAEA